MGEGIVCPECDCQFTVIWNTVEGPPEYCPMCGCEMDYQQVAEDMAREANQ